MIENIEIENDYGEVGGMPNSPYTNYVVRLGMNAYRVDNGDEIHYLVAENNEYGASVTQYAPLEAWWVFAYQMDGSEELKQRIKSDIRRQSL